LWLGNSKKNVKTQTMKVAFTLLGCCNFFLRHGQFENKRWWQSDSLNLAGNVENRTLTAGNTYVLNGPTLKAVLLLL
jgi:hypothetical protein